MSCDRCSGTVREALRLRRCRLSAPAGPASGTSAGALGLLWEHEAPWAGKGRREERRLVGRHRPEGRQEEAGGDQLLSITPRLCSAGSSASPSTTPTFPTSAAGLARSCSGGPGASPSSSTSSPRSRITLPVNSKRSVPRLSGNDAAQLPGGRGQDATASLSRGPCSFPVPVPVLREGRAAPQQGWGNFNQRTWQGNPSLRD